MRKILGFFLSIAILAGMYVPANAKTVSEEKHDMMLSVLSAIDIIEINEDKVFNPEEKVSRAKFSEYVAKAMGLEPTFSMKYFSDVGQDVDECGYINTLTDYGVISLNEEKIFAPERIISYAEACKMLVCAMGYGDYAMSRGGTMSTWVAVAADAGINISPVDYNALSAKEAVALLYNAMYEPVMANIPGQHEMYIDHDKNLFAENHDVYFAYGVVNAVNGAHLERYDMPRAGLVTIDGKDFNTDLDLRAYLGTEVEYVYRYDETLDEGTVFYVRLRDEDSVVTFTSDLLEGFDDATNTFRYWRNAETNKTKDVDIEKQHQIIFNGAPYTGTVRSAISGFLDGTRRGEITITDPDRNGDFDIVIIKSYDVFPIGSVDTIGEFICGGFDQSNISYENCEYFKIFSDEGEELELSDYAGVVLNVAQSQNGDILEIIISSKTAEFEIHEVDSTECKVYSTDGTVYNVDSRVMAEYETSLFALNRIKVSLDVLGYIVKIEIAPSDGYQFGYLISGKSYDDGTGTDVVDAKIYTRAGKIEKFVFADRISIDNIGYKLSKRLGDALTAIPGTSFQDDEDGITRYTLAHQLIRYRVNEEGKIYDIDTTVLSVYEEDTNSLVCRHDKAPLMNTNRLGLDTYWSSSHTATFTIPTLNDQGKIKKNGVWTDPQAKDFSTSLSMSFDHTYTMSTYYCSDDSYYVDALIITQDSAYLAVNAMIYTGTKRVWDEEEQEVLTAVECISGGSETRYTFAPGVEANIASQGITYGDLFYIELDGARKYATGIKKIFDAETLKFIHNSSNDYWYYGAYSQYSNWSYRTGENNRNQLSKMYALKKRAGAVFGTYERTDLSKGLYQEVMYIGDVPVIIVDKRNEHTEKGSFNSIQSYEESGSSGSLILVESLTQNAKSVIIYR